MVGTQQHDDGGNRRDREPGIDRRDEGERRYGKRQNSEQRDFARMRNKDADGAAIDRAAEGAKEIVDRCLQRPSDVHLRDDDGRQDRPQWQVKVQE